MAKYFIKTPWLAKKLFPSYVWKMPASEKKIFLTFDDGPHPTITPLVLDELKKYDARGTFFCIGKNVVEYPDIYQRIVNEGHSVGNHTYNHLNGWHTPTGDYLHDISLASEVIDSNLFRPPYGRIKRTQARRLSSAMNTDNVCVIMWDVLSGDFDRTISPEQCLQNVLSCTTAGSIIVFHDSEKAVKNLFFVLPVILKKFSDEGYEFPKL